MKPASVFVLLCTCLAFLPPAVQAQSLADPGFEMPAQTLLSTGATPCKALVNGVVADGWQDNTGWADNVALHYSLDLARPHSGATSQRIVVEKGFAQFVQPVHFQAGGYHATLWARAEPAQWVALTLRLAGAPYTAYAAQPVYVGENWTPLTLDGMTPDTDGYFLVNVSRPGTVWLDDAVLSHTAVSPVQTLSPPKAIIPHAFFGLNVNHMHDGAGYGWPALDFGTYRTWDSGVDWVSIEKSPGVYDWTYLDRDVAEAQKHHTEFLFTLGQTPQWASSDPNKPSEYGSGQGAPPADIQVWKEFVSAVAVRYKGRIHAYEIWNEPDLNFYTGTPAQLVALEEAAVRVIHIADPSAVVLSPPPSGVLSFDALKWYADYLDAGGGKTVDGVAYHSYEMPAERNIAALRTFQGLLRAHGLAGKPLWLTEAGVNHDGHTEPEAIGHIGRLYMIAWALGLDRLCFYAYDNEYYFGLDRQTGDPKQAANRDPSLLGPTGVAYQEIERWLTGARMLSCASDAHDVWVCRLSRPGGRSAWIVWNAQLSAGTSTSFAPPAAWHIKTRRDLAGMSARVSGASVPIGPAPLLLEP